jgi:hypothetical protein
LAIPLLAACMKTSAVSTGDLLVVTQGDSSLEDGIPASDFEDGWSVRFDRFVVNLGAVGLGSEPADVMPLGDAPFVLVDHVVLGSKTIVLANDVVARAWPAFAYELRAVRSTTTASDGTTDEDLARMRAMAASALIKGVATKGDTSKTFEWVFGEATAYENCRVVDGAYMQKGVVVVADTTTVLDLPISGKPLFEDDLASVKPKSRFEPIANADTNGDGVVTLSELDRVRLADVHATYGNYLADGSTTIVTMRDFIAAQLRRVGGFRNALGSCQSRPL